MACVDGRAPGRDTTPPAWRLPPGRAIIDRMSKTSPGVPLWARAVADSTFRDALIADPLRALADAGDVVASVGQVQQLEEMTGDERAEFVAGVVREVHWNGALARFGPLRRDGRIGGPPD